jgi:hypothetical protein
MSPRCCTTDAESHLLELATALDISGRSPEWWPAGFREAVVLRHLRLGLREEFVRCFQDQADRKPHSSAANAIGKNGIAQRMATNVLEECLHRD